MYNIIMLSFVMLGSGYYYSECHYADVVTLSVFMLCVISLRPIMLCSIMQSAIIVTVIMLRAIILRFIILCHNAELRNSVFFIQNVGMRSIIFWALSLYWVCLYKAHYVEWHYDVPLWWLLSFRHWLCWVTLCFVIMVTVVIMTHITLCVVVD
jgi:hypothetical protein